MSGRLIIVGAGGHGREALAIARRHPAWPEIALVDDGDVERERLERVGATLTGTVDDLINSGSDHVIAVGDPGVRRSIADRIGDAAPATTLVDPSAWIGDDVDLAPGAMVYPAAVCTTNIRIGRHSHVNCGAIVSHDCRVGDFVSISPGVRLNGEVVIGDGVLLGTGAVVLPGRTVGQGAVVGAGAVVVDDVDPGSTVVGIPAR
ncbi:MAG: acetyltransferase [Actinomycetota bacterium]